MLNASCWKILAVLVNFVKADGYHVKHCVGLGWIISQLCSCQALLNAKEFGVLLGVSHFLPACWSKQHHLQASLGACQSHIGGTEHCKQMENAWHDCAWQDMGRSLARRQSGSRRQHHYLLQLDNTPVAW